MVLFTTITLVSANDAYYYDRWKLFTDSYDYLAQAKMDLSSLNFWFPEKTDGFSPRPFTVPLIYKMIGEDISHIILWQKIIHFLSALLLCISVSFFIHRLVLKYLFTVFICIVFCWWNILGWTQLILSESLSFSFAILWISSFLFFLKFSRRSLLLTHIVIMILFLFTRDSWSYVLLLFYLLWILTAYILSKKHIRSGLCLFLICFAAFFVQQQAISIGKRQVLPVVNNLAVRVVKEPVYLAYFEKKGMPMATELKNEFSEIDFTVYENRRYLYELYSNPKYIPLLNWVEKDGKNTYLKFMLTHPSYLLMLKEPDSKLRYFYVRNLYQYTLEPLGISCYVDGLFPVFSYPALFIFVIIMLILYIKRNSFIGMIFIALYVALIANAIIIYNADSLETERHLFNDSVFVELLGAVFFCFILDSINYNRIMNYLRLKKTS